MRTKLLYASGVMALISAILHASFWVLFDWGKELPKLNHINAAIMQMLNIVTIFAFAYQCFAAWVLAKKAGPFSVAEKSILVFTGGVFFLRAAFGFPLFGMYAREVVVVIMCMLAAVANLWALKLAPARESSRRI